MAKTGAGLGSAGQVALLAAGVAALAGLLWYAQRPAPEAGGPAPVPLAAPIAPKPAEPTPAAPTPVAPLTAAPPAVPEGAPAAVPETVVPDVAEAPPASETELQPSAPPPSFDTVRITPEGEALVAGRAASGAEISLRVDGAEAARVAANGQGDFVAMFTLPPSSEPRTLTLALLGPDGLVVAPDSVVLEPIRPAVAAPVVTAGAEPAPPEDAPTAILLSETGAKVLQGPTSAPDGGVTIAAITYTPDGAVQLSGLGVAGASLRLYLDNAMVGETTVAAGGAWSAVLRNVVPGLYTLRADQLDASGKVAARFETPFLRETPEALAAAMKPRAVSGTPVPRVAGATPPATAPAPPVSALAPSAEGLTAAADPLASAAPQQPVSITVQPGFTLWRIARESFGEGVMYVKVFEANKGQIRDPDLIYPGQVFVIPEQ